MFSQLTMMLNKLLSLTQNVEYCSVSFFLKCVLECPSQTVISNLLICYCRFLRQIEMQSNRCYVNMAPTTMYKGGHWLVSKDMGGETDVCISNGVSWWSSSIVIDEQHAAFRSFPQVTWNCIACYVSQPLTLTSHIEPITRETWYDCLHYIVRWKHSSKTKYKHKSQGQGSMSLICISVNWAGYVKYEDSFYRSYVM